MNELEDPSRREKGDYTESGVERGWKLDGNATGG